VRAEREREFQIGQHHGVPEPRARVARGEMGRRERNWRIGRGKITRVG